MPENGSWLSRIFGRKSSTEPTALNSIEDVEEIEEAIEEEIKVDPKIKEEAERLLVELKAHQGKKCLALVIDDVTYNTYDFVLKPLRKHTEKSGVGYVTSYQQDAINGVNLYREFKTIDDKEEPQKVVVMLDGNLTRDQTGPFQYGIEVATEIARISKENDWQMPYLVGESSDWDKNEALAEAYPDQYLGDWNEFKIFPVIEEKL